jgi:hypothetical protein
MSVSVCSSDDFSAAHGRQLQHLPNLGGSGKHHCAQPVRPAHSFLDLVRLRIIGNALRAHLSS